MQKSAGSQYGRVTGELKCEQAMNDSNRSDVEKVRLSEVKRKTVATLFNRVSGLPPEINFKH